MTQYGRTQDLCQRMTLASAWAQGTKNTGDSDGESAKGRSGDLHSTQGRTHAIRLAARLDLVGMVIRDRRFSSTALWTVHVAQSTVHSLSVAFDPEGVVAGCHMVPDMLAAGSSGG
jgi:hypothetical protein